MIPVLLIPVCLIPVFRRPLPFATLSDSWQRVRPQWMRSSPSARSPRLRRAAALVAWQLAADGWIRVSRSWGCVLHLVSLNSHHRHPTGAALPTYRANGVETGPFSENEIALAMVSAICV